MARLKRKSGQYHHGRLKEALISAGRALLAQRGLQGFTLRECARRARVSHAAPAHHFASVDDLLAEIAARGFEDLTAAMDAAAAGKSRARERLVALGRGYVGFALSNRSVFQLMFNRDAHGKSSGRLAGVAEAAYRRLTEAIAAVNPERSPAVQQVMVDLAWASVHGFAMLALGGELGHGGAADPAFARRLDAVLDAVLTAIVR